jgi:hypothetical protein
MRRWISQYCLPETKGRGVDEMSAKCWTCRSELSPYSATLRTKYKLITIFCHLADKIQTDHHILPPCGQNTNCSPYSATLRTKHKLITIFCHLADKTDTDHHILPPCGQKTSWSPCSATLRTKHKLITIFCHLVDKTQTDHHILPPCIQNTNTLAVKCNLITIFYTLQKKSP